VGIVLGFVALMVAAPSFLSDYREFFILTYQWPVWTEWAVFAIIVILAATLILKMLAPELLKKIIDWFRTLTGRIFNRKGVRNPA
jgi:membrane protein implicated in regulation of membrane protease activity